MKLCNGCSRDLADTCFAKNSGSADGLQSRCRECRQRYRENNYSKGKTCGVCDKPIVNHASKGLCQKHRAEFLKTSHRRDGHTDPRGYVVLSGWADHPNARKHNGCILEHTLVMSEVLGRPLLPKENVHHINGDRADNRPENLELWSSSQPPGQRVADKLTWAREIVSLYGGTHEDPDH